MLCAAGVVGIGKTVYGAVDIWMSNGGQDNEDKSRVKQESKL